MSPERGGKRLRDTVSTLSEMVMSRNNLEKIIRQFDLYQKDRQKLPIEDVIESLRDLDYRIEEIAEQTEKLPTEKRDH